MAKKDYILNTPNIKRSLSPNCYQFFKPSPKQSIDYLSQSRQLISGIKKEKPASLAKFETTWKIMEDYNNSNQKFRAQTNYEPSRNLLKFKSLVQQQEQENKEQENKEKEKSKEKTGANIDNNKSRSKNKTLTFMSLSHKIGKQNKSGLKFLSKSADFKIMKHF